MIPLTLVRAKIREAIGTPEGSIVYGRPLHLADVLRAIERTKSQEHNVPSFRQIGIDCSGWYVESSLGEWQKAPRWNLALPLDEQSPEVIEFLAKVLQV